MVLSWSKHIFATKTLFQCVHTYFSILRDNWIFVASITISEAINNIPAILLFCFPKFSKQTRSCEQDISLILLQVGGLNNIKTSKKQYKAQ